MDRHYSDHRLSRVPFLPGPDDAAFGVTLVLLCSLAFLLGEQATSLTVSADQMGVTSPEGNVTKQAILASIYAGIGLLLVARTRASEWTAIGLPLTLLLALCFVSVAWSDLPSLTLRRSVALLGTFALGTYAGLRLDEHRISRVLLASSWVVLLASFALAALMPAYGFDPEGRLRGVFAHKNGMGSFAALSMLVALVYLPLVRPGRSRVLHLSLALPCTVAIVLAGSVTPTIALFFALAVLILQARYGVRACVVPLLAVVAIGLLAPLFAWKFGDVALLLGRDSDFSGRTRVWLFCLEFLERNPVFGYGYSAFWVSPAALLFERWSGFPVPNAHNGYLDLAIGVGIPGAALAVAAVVRVIWKHSVLGRESGVHSGSFTAGLLAFLLVMNINENTLINGNGVFSMLFVYLVVRGNMAVRTPIDEGDLPAQPAVDSGLHSPGVLR